MKFKSSKSLAHDQAENLLAHGSDDDIRETLVFIALNDGDWAWVQGQCLRYMRHPNWSVRAVAATCVGHVARIHRKLNTTEVLPILMELMNDQATAEYAQNALDDIRMYLPDPQSL